MQPDNTPQQELEDLEALVASPGWARFRAMIDREWGAEAYRGKARKILASVGSQEMSQAAQLLAQLEVSTHAIDGMFALVEERIKKLQHGGQRALAR